MDRRDSVTDAAAVSPQRPQSLNMLETVSKMLTNGTCVALTMYPLDRAIHAIQINGSNLKASTGLGKYLFSFAYLQSQFNPFLASAKVYVQRNAVATNRGKIAEGIDGLEVLETPLMKAGVLAASISAVNTLLTNKGSNDRAWAFQQHDQSDTFQKPKIKTTAEYVKACLACSPARFVRNTFDISGLIMSEYIKSSLHEELPDYHLPNSVINCAAIAGASVSMGLAENVFDVLSRNQAIRVDPANLKVPALWTVAKDMIRANGPKVFLRGSLLSCFYQVVYCASFPLIEQASDQVVPSVIGFFSTKKLSQPDTLSSVHECKASGFGR
jgi:hypothetical protein